MEVIDNFLPEDQFQTIERILMGSYFTWNYFPGKLYAHQSGSFQFSHNFYREGDTPSGYFSILKPILDRLGGNLVRAKAVLTPQTHTPQGSGYHVDYPNMKTAAFYINTNNGYTKFRREWGDWAVVNGYPEDPDHERIVESRSNRMVIFDSNLEHSGYTCTDEKVRVLVNFNYEGN